MEKEVKNLFWIDLAEKKAVPKLEALLELAVGEDNKSLLRAVEHVLDRAYGKPKETKVVTGVDDGPLQIEDVTKTAALRDEYETKMRELLLQDL